MIPGRSISRYRFTSRRNIDRAPTVNLPCCCIKLRGRWCISTLCRRVRIDFGYGLTSCAHRLFIAPVESDLPPKASDKSRATSPNRSGIRRHGRTDYRERRAAMRRHLSIRDRERGERDLMARWRPSPLRESHRVSRIGPDVDATTGPSLPDSVRFRDGPRETRPEDPRRSTLEEQLTSLFRDNWPAPGTANEQPDDQVDLGWWTVETVPRYNHARIVSSWPLLLPADHLC